MEDWILSVILALFIIMPCWLAIRRGKETQKQVEAWTVLAQRTGLTYMPGYPRSVRGEYRGRHIYLTLFTFSDQDHDAPMFQNTSIRLDVQNCASFLLAIQAKKVFSGNLDFDRHYEIIGSPREYLLGVVNLIIQSDVHLLAWIMQNLPSFELKGECLVCDQNGELTNVDDQNALLNLLCDLADLAEEMGSESASSDARRN